MNDTNDITAAATDLVDRYLATWNEGDPAARRAAIDALWTEDGAYTDPLAAVVGPERIDAVIGAAREQFAGLVFRAAGTPDAHHDLVRFGWELAPEGGEALVVGFDVAVLAADGRIRAVHGFLDRVPAGV